MPLRIPADGTDSHTAQPATYDVRDIAALLSCSERTARRHADQGIIPRPMKLGGLLRWNRAEIDAWLAAGCPPVRIAGRK